ncbi:A24 family peptidase [Oceanisphaera psychrotolerans]|uniref:Peptidase A24 n=1 Tax=Oceanisphaera psychrotolerans TaxID=1414654 RepID=A0A1J4QCR8_9GAMM|nr:A24 family peptidase [Oceanisphaera psychrotolerans]OIN06625.1 peptidase A24 [Oceanisphaera psychrotolerans]
MEQLPLFTLLLAASWLDLTTHKIPNWLTLPFIPLALIYHGFIGDGLAFGLTGLVYAFILLFPLFFFRLLAGGDVKLGLCIGAFLGWKLFLESLLYGLVIGLPLVLVFAFYKVGWSGFKQSFMRYGYILGTKKYLAPVEGELAGLKVPYGPALALGAILAMALNHFEIYTLVQ